MSGEITEIIEVSVVFGTGMIVAVTWLGTRAWLKVESLKRQGQERSSRESVDAVESLRQEVANLRDTTTRYDMAFDTALQRIESRVAHLEGQRREESASILYQEARRTP